MSEKEVAFHHYKKHLEKVVIGFQGESTPDSFRQMIHFKRMLRLHLKVPKSEVEDYTKEFLNNLKEKGYSKGVSLYEEMIDKSLKYQQ